MRDDRSGPRANRVRWTTAVALTATVLAGCGAPRTTPEVDAPVPDVVLTIEQDGWSDLPLQLLCLEVVAEGDLEPARDGGLPTDYTAALVEALGAAIVDEGCDATLTVDLRAELVAGNYGPVCYQGRDISATATLVAPGMPDLIGSYSLVREPPDTILETQCVESPQVPTAMWQGILTSDSEDNPGILIELLGDRARLAQDMTISAGGLGTPKFARNAQGDPLAPWVLDTLAAGLHADDRARRGSTATVVDALADDLWERSEELLPLVPHLIWALAEEDAAELETLGEMDDGKGDIPLIRAQLGWALEEITNEEIDYRADLWWEWWQNH